MSKSRSLKFLPFFSMKAKPLVLFPILQAMLLLKNLFVKYAPAIPANAVPNEEIKDLHAKVDAVLNQLPREATAQDSEKFAEAQAKADTAYRAIGDQAPAPMRGESLMSYRIRLASPLQAKSADYAKANLSAISADEYTFNMAESKIYGDAIHAAENPMVEGCTIVPIVRNDGGRKVIQYRANAGVATMEGASGGVFANNAHVAAMNVGAYGRGH